MEEVYPIGVASKILGVHPRMLRIYEKEGLVKPRRIGGKRYYTKEQLQFLKCVRFLLSQGINIAGVKKLLSVVPCWRAVGCSLGKRINCDYFRTSGRSIVKIAFAAESCDGLNAEISTHFRKAPYFIFVELDSDGEVVSVEVKENPFVTIHGPGLVPKFIAENGADIVVSGGMGERAAMLFKDLGIEPVVGAEGRVLDALNRILKGEGFKGGFCSHDECTEKHKGGEA